MCHWQKAPSYQMGNLQTAETGVFSLLDAEREVLGVMSNLSFELRKNENKTDISLYHIYSPKLPENISLVGCYGKAWVFGR